MEWKTVGRRGFRNAAVKWDIFPFGGMQVGFEEEISSFYISEFSDRSRAEDIFRLFGCLGDIVEVVIPPKRNKFGRRFGFARFKGVEDARLLGVKLDNILIDGKKIYANLPRFVRGAVSRGMDGRKSQVGAAQKETTRRFVVKSVDRKANQVVKGISYADVISSGVSGANIAKGVITDVGRQQPSISFASSEECKLRWKKSFVGEVLFPGETYNIQTHLEIEGFFLVKVHPMGANLCMLEEMEEGVIQELLNDASSWWKQWFRSIRPWKETDIDKERILWIRVHGTPCHAWCSEFFQNVANGLGEFVCVDENTSSGDNMDIARIMIRVPFSFKLQETLKVSIDGVEHVLVLREDTYGPVRKVRDVAPSKSSVASSSDSASGFSSLAIEEESMGTVGSLQDLPVFSDEDVEVEVQGNKVGEGFEAANGIIEEISVPFEIGAEKDSCLNSLFASRVPILGDEVQQVVEASLVSGKGVEYVAKGIDGPVDYVDKVKKLADLSGPKSKTLNGPSFKIKTKKKYNVFNKRKENGSYGPSVGPKPISSNKVVETEGGGSTILLSSNKNLEKPAESDICRCNQRILLNFDASAESKLQNCIAKLGVVGGDHRREDKGKLEGLKILTEEAKEGGSVLKNRL
ncbi:uncharacterized protein LOC131604933 [Vicia villosa]|uniref:uncharacterized protein LOC131604933 n=1 Tax=Vicia villosa TaxID=3911 RepID=UPI00273C68B1|nr:uncharacterized protein LOC131604933 [Vicia villosa]